MPRSRLAVVRWSVPLAICILVAVFAGMSWAGATRAPCLTSRLVVWLNTESGGAAAGSTYYKLEFTNLSGRPCTLRGYPGVSAVDLRGRQIGSAAGRNPSSPTRTITLAKSGSAVAVLRIADAFNYPAAACRRTTAAGLRVYPPNQTTARTVPFPFVACARTGPIYLSIGPVQHS